MFYFDKIDNKKILKSDLIKGALAFFTTKDICICDKGKSINLEVQNNKKIVTKYLNIEQKNLIYPEQTHSSNIDIVKLSQTNYPDTDALILTNTEQTIFLNFADCTPIIFYDKKQNIGAIAHAGWRGTVQKIAQKTAQKLIDEFDSKSENITALIGPAICEKCYEVGEEVYSNFYKNYSKKEKYYINLKEINRKQLTEIGIENIDVCPYCTCCDNEYFYSYRKEKGTNLRHSAVLKLNK